MEDYNIIQINKSQLRAMGNEELAKKEKKRLLQRFIHITRREIFNEALLGLTCHSTIFKHALMPDEEVSNIIINGVKERFPDIDVSVTITEEATIFQFSWTE